MTTPYHTWLIHDDSHWLTVHDDWDWDFDPSGNTTAPAIAPAVEHLPSCPGQGLGWCDCPPDPEEDEPSPGD